MAAYLVTKTHKTTIARFPRLDWDTVGRICTRVVADELDPERRDGLVHIGVDEVSWKKRAHDLTLVTGRDTGEIDFESLPLPARLVPQGRSLPDYRPCTP